jgi:hypothetical protein
LLAWHLHLNSLVYWQLDSILTRYPALSLEVWARERLAPWLESGEEGDDQVEDDGDGQLDRDETEGDDDEGNGTDNDEGLNEESSEYDESDEVEDADAEEEWYHNIQPHQSDAFVTVMSKLGSVYSRHYPAMRFHHGIAAAERYPWSLVKIYVKWYSRKEGAGAQPEELRRSLYEVEEREPGTTEIDMRGFIWDTNGYFSTTLCEERIRCMDDNL